MADLSIAGFFKERIEDRFVRDCQKPADPPVQHRKTTKVLSIAADCPAPDEVIVNGLKFYRVQAA